MKYELKDYHIGEIARFYGLSVDAVRLYDKKGILSPAKDGETRYRIYSKEDLVTMDFVMRMRRLDISLDHIRQMMYDTDLESIHRIVAEKEAEVAEQIRQLQKKEKLLRDYRCRVEECIANLDKVEIVQSPVFICKEVEDSMARVMEDFDDLEQTAIPLLTIFPGGNVEDCIKLEFLESLTDRKTRQQVNRYMVSLVDETGLSQREDFPREKFCVIGPQKCLHGFSTIYTNRDYTPLSFFSDYIKEHGLRLQGVPMVRILANECEDAMLEYLELWIPVE